MAKNFRRKTQQNTLGYSVSPSSTLEEVNAQLLKLVSSSSYSETSAKETVSYWNTKTLIACLKVMQNVKPWEEWHGSPWEVVFDRTISIVSIDPFLKDTGLAFPDESWRRAIRRLPETHFKSLVVSTYATPFLVDWIKEHLNSDSFFMASEALHLLLESKTLTSKRIGELWGLSVLTTDPKYKDYYQNLRTTILFLRNPKMPLNLVKEFLLTPPAATFNWTLLNDVIYYDRYAGLVAELGGADALAEKVNEKSGGWDVTRNSKFSNRVRTLAALAEKPSRFVSRFYDSLDFSLKEEILLLLREEAGELGLDPTLPVGLLLETVWEADCTAYHYLNDENLAAV